MNTLNQIVFFVSRINLKIAVLVFASDDSRLENAGSIGSIKKKS